MEYINWITCKSKTSQYWEFFNISINLDKLEEHKNEKGYVNLVMSKRKEVWKYGETHSFKLNDWKPEEKKTNEFGDVDLSIPF